MSAIKLFPLIQQQNAALTQHGKEILNVIEFFRRMLQHFEQLAHNQDGCCTAQCFLSIIEWYFIHYESSRAPP
jgi:hypothetical protein